MSSSNKFIADRLYEIKHTPWWETSPALPSWLTATTPASTTHTAAALQSGRYYQLLIQTAAAAATEVKVETTGSFFSGDEMRIEVDNLRFSNSTSGDADYEIYIRGASAGFTLLHTASAGKTQGQFVGQSAVDSGFVELVTNQNGPRIKNIGLHLIPGERLAHVLVDGRIARTFEASSFLTNQTDLKAGFKMVKRGAGGDIYFRYGEIRVAAE